LVWGQALPVSAFRDILSLALGRLARNGLGRTVSVERRFRVPAEVDPGYVERADELTLATAKVIGNHADETGIATLAYGGLLRAVLERHKSFGRAQRRRGEDDDAERAATQTLFGFSIKAVERRERDMMSAKMEIPCGSRTIDY
jgi:hypothetical protein